MDPQEEQQPDLVDEAALVLSARLGRHRAVRREELRLQAAERAQAEAPVAAERARLGGAPLAASEWDHLVTLLAADPRAYAKQLTAKNGGCNR